MKEFDEKLVNKLNDFRLFGIPQYIDKISLLCVPLDDLNSRYASVRQVGKGIRDFFKNELVQKYKYHYSISNDNKMLLWYGTYWYRGDHYKAFESFSSQFPYSDFVRAEKLDKPVYHPFRVISGIGLLLVWSIQSLTQGFSLRNLLYFLPFLKVAQDSDKSLKKINPSKYKLFVVYSDLSPDENCLVQYFNKEGIDTATLQHGAFSIKKSREKYRFEGIQYIYSKSKYFLTWNQYTVDMVNNAGYDTKNYVVLGMPKYINFISENLKQTEMKKGVFGVLLNVYAPDLDEQNKKMIKVANEIAERLNCKYVVRYHPTMDNKTYENLYSERFLEVDKTKTIADHASSVDFTILGSSSALIELIFLNHPTFRLKTGDDDYFSDIPFGYFSTAEEFTELYNDTSKLDSERSKIFEYLCTTYNIKENYDNFFRSKLALNEN